MSAGHADAVAPARADVVADSIVELSVHCTGDRDESVQREHAEKVRLLRP